MHTFLTVAILVFVVLGAAFFVGASWRLGGQLDQAHEQLHRERDPQEADERLATQDDLGRAA